MNEEERKRIAAERKAAYRKRKRAEELAHQAPPDSTNPDEKNPPEELTTLFNAQARNVTPELEEAFRNTEGNSEIRPVYQDNHKDELADMLAASEERGRRTKLIMSMYQRDAERTNKLLWHILETLTRMRLEMVDLIGGLRNGK